MKKRNKYHSPSNKKQGKKPSFRFSKKKKQKKTNTSNTKITLDQLIHHPKKSAAQLMTTDISFKGLGLKEQLASNIKQMGLTHLTPVQVQCWNPILEGKNIKAIAQTGTGKTIGFLLPLIHRMFNHNTGDKVMIIVPTRELALQIEESCTSLLKEYQLVYGSFIGGRSYKNDLIKLEQEHDIVIGTTGRLTELVRKGQLILNSFNVLILDEYDRMLDMGFHKDVKFLSEKMYSRDQTLLFSATMDPNVKKKVGELVGDALSIKVSSGKETGQMIRQDIVKYDKHKKFDKLLDLLIDPSLNKVLIFCDTRDQVEQLFDHLDAYAVPVDLIHGEKTQAYRKRALDKFKTGKIRVLVATDVASRGLDIEDISHVINYYMPPDYETYIHRIGRTGRAGRMGLAWTFVSK